MIYRDKNGQWAWRIVAGNHRSLGVSATPFASESEAIAFLERLQRAPRLTPQIAHPRSSLTWNWTALNESGELVARGDREYGRYGTCVSAFRRFVTTLESLATTDPVVDNR